MWTSQLPATDCYVFNIPTVRLANFAICWIVVSACRRLLGATDYYRVQLLDEASSDVLQNGTATQPIYSGEQQRLQLCHYHCQPFLSFV